MKKYGFTKKMQCSVCLKLVVMKKISNGICKDCRDKGYIYNPWNDHMFDE